MDLIYHPRLDRKPNEESKSKKTIPVYILSCMVSCVIKASVVESRWMPLIDTIHQSTLSQSILDWHLGWHSIDRVSAKYRSRCQSTVKRDVDQVLIEGIKFIGWHRTTGVFSSHDPKYVLSQCYSERSLSLLVSTKNWDFWLKSLGLKLAINHSGCPLHTWSKTIVKLAFKHPIKLEPRNSGTDALFHLEY